MKQTKAAQNKQTQSSFVIAIRPGQQVQVQAMMRRGR
ncbi:unnamed protein product [Fusarium graminearum]|uniref:Chromosome 4, complete genome n=1 Tax=Gibberella zeae (strain ATCC MYA-4620 / CBS 123657 / FGSC 9075 / NRRL 31084 / PH-1) TaxID=229533 RepID=A0A0E0SG23_GIBZE|nr:hypothetical protein FG05_35250 [Fusarium graminearum]CEF85386.1 unnamed protein product [Fusarium graminearum]